MASAPMMLMPCFLVFGMEGTTNYTFMLFYVNGLLMLSDDGYIIKWSHPVDSYLFLKEHLCSTMGAEYYFHNHIQVPSFDEVIQAVGCHKINTNASGLF